MKAQLPASAAPPALQDPGRHQRSAGTTARTAGHLVSARIPGESRRSRCAACTETRTPGHVSMATPAATVVRRRPRTQARHFRSGAGVAASLLSTGPAAVTRRPFPSGPPRDPHVRDSPACEKVMRARPQLPATATQEPGEYRHPLMIGREDASLTGVDASSMPSRSAARHPVRSTREPPARSRQFCQRSADAAPNEILCGIAGAGRLRRWRLMRAAELCAATGQPRVVIASPWAVV